MAIVGYTKCVKCGKVIAVTKQIETNTGYKYVSADTPARYIDRWGYKRNFCKGCIK